MSNQQYEECPGVKTNSAVKIIQPYRHGKINALIKRNKIDNKHRHALIRPPPHKTSCLISRQYNN